MQEIKIKLLDHQSRFIDSSKRYILNSGGVGSGKTWTICLKSILLAIRYPGIFILLGAQTYPLLRDTTLREFLNIIPDGLVKSYNKTEQHFIFKNGSEVIFRSFDDANKLKSLNLGACGIEEMTDVSEEIFKMLRTRLRQDGMPCCLYGATNPNTFENWVYKYFIDSPIEGSEVIYSISADNMYLPEAYLNDLKELKKSNPEYYSRMVMGQWGALEGVIYSLPLSQRIQEGPKKLHRVIAGLDFGFTHPTALVVVGIREANYYVIDEIYRHKQSSSDVIEFCRAKMREHGIDIFYCDPARPDMIEELKRNGIPAYESDNKVFDGIMIVKGLIGSGRLHVINSCHYTLREFDAYIWDAKNPLKEVPLKVNDHAMDALRYALVTDSSGLIEFDEKTIEYGNDTTMSKMDF
jgi:PBSX family phage terminase large subunit